MKKLALFTIMLLATGNGASAQARQNHLWVDAQDLSADVLTPNAVYFLQGRARQTKPTWTLVETGDGDSTITAGYLTQVEKGDHLSLYRIGDTTFALPSKHYSMPSDGILRTRRGKKIEALTVEFDQCPCDKNTSIRLNKDSVTENTAEPYKMVLEIDGVEWRREGSYLVPGISMEEVGMADSATVSAYGLGIVTSEGTVCSIMWLHLEQRDGATRTQVYEPSFREGKRFGLENGLHTFDGHTIEGFQIFRDARPEAKGAKKQKHERKARKQKSRVNQF